MQSELLDITIIGCLVLLFGSAYRKRPSKIVRAWILGWLLVLLHFVALLFHPKDLVLTRILLAASLVALFACGLVFLSVLPGRLGRREGAASTLVLAGIGILISIVLDVWEVQPPAAYLGAGACVTLAWLSYESALRQLSQAARIIWFVSVGVTSWWFAWSSWHRLPDIAVSALATQLFVLVSIGYIGTVRRISAGTLTMSLGLLAWAAVFPTAELLEHLRLGSHVHPEFWNVPKYFVAFGMLLMLLEEEIIAANEAGRMHLLRASHDQLTGLRNRAALEQDLQAAVEKATRHSTRCALICFDLDRFKHINDTYGHGVGDICLRTTGERLSQFLSDQRSVARIGGEEFAMVLCDLQEHEVAKAVAERVLRAVGEPILIGAFPIETTASVGLAMFPKDGQDPATLWRNADAAMYQAKKAGGNQLVAMCPEILKLTTDSNDMELALRRALRDDALELAFQPILDADGKIHSIEALVRLRHPELGIVLPDRFISVAEERGLIVPLGDWVLKAACAQIASWRARDITHVPIALNISALQITSPQFAASVLGVLSRFEVAPSLIAMEITETAMLRNPAEASRQIDILGAAGISFSIDDFGVGYSSLSQLDKLRVDHVKIDRSFVCRMNDAEEARSIVAAIISMAHGMGLRVVAEGIEDGLSWDRLVAMSCDLFQGFLFGKPMSPTETERFLMTTRKSAACRGALPSGLTAPVKRV